MAIARITAELARLAAARAHRAATTLNAAARRRAEQAAEREEATHGQGRMRIARAPGPRTMAAAKPQPVFDRAKITAETKLDGKRLLSTSDPDLSMEGRRGPQGWTPATPDHQPRPHLDSANVIPPRTLNPM